MAVLITGAAGFIGAHIVKKMLENGRDVHGFDRVKPGPSVLRSWGDDVPFQTADVADREAVFSAVRKAQGGPIIHLAGILTAGCDRDPEAALAVNVQGMRHVLDAAREGGAKRVVLASTIGVYGPGLPQPITEEMPREPEGWYGLTKLMAEEMGMLYARRHGIDFRAARFAAITGAGRSAGSGSASLFTSFIPEKAALGEPYEIEVEEDTAYPVIYIRDAVEALFLLSIAESAPHRIYNIASGRIVTAELVEAVKELIPEARLSYRPDPAVMAVVRGYREWHIDCHRAGTDLGWRPKYGVQAMVRDIIETARSKPAHPPA
jgi:nucleoside-diphosphate-sugar epimerase